MSVSATALEAGHNVSDEARYTEKYPDNTNMSTYDTTGLPTLEQVLSRKTLPPVCLYNFYIIMRDRLHSEELLDFYLDVQHHEILWRRYVKGMKKSGHIDETDLTDGFHGPKLVSRLSYASLRRDELARSPSPARSRSPELGQNTSTQQLVYDEDGRSADDGARRTNYSRPMSPSMPRGPLVESAPVGQQDSAFASIVPGGGGSSPTREDVTASCEKIYYTYIVQSAHKEIFILPGSVRSMIAKRIEQDERDDPAVFAEAKDIVFESMQRHGFPKFLRCKVWGNTTMWQQLGRLVFGLSALFLGFAIELSLILLGHERWGERFWGLIPIFFGMLNVMIGLSGLDPIWALVFNISETTTFHFNQVRQPQVKKILKSRAMWLLTLSIVLSVIVTVIFAAIPGHRL
ncbi:hypothetical protein INT44_003666 [Umbelopsis vinacea]|uniref:RGS domain-containing protein n=1 Tax=Umbelopsis vinacea TaxID=44442 RepID=A0A8H7PU80_9FUNG|nr:hypothetical protein INT44_003666 [Umbelopsis vinacea]KAI9288889.1 hypothetical protein BC943DRAFT_123791 [Umbelopsis sp. AD052]